MKAIILAAGPCKRLRPLTENLSKCMLKIGGKPIIQNTIELFRNDGITDIFQEMIDKREGIYTVLIQNNWKELDTIEDYERVNHEVKNAGKS